MTEAIRNRPDFDKRMAQARARAQWELGDPSWADLILRAFLYPEEDAVLLREDRSK